MKTTALVPTTAVLTTEHFQLLFHLCEELKLYLCEWQSKHRARA